MPLTWARCGVRNSSTVAVMEMAITSEICSLVWTTVCQKKLAPCYAIAQRMKDSVLLLCLAITMTPRLNHVKSSDIQAVVEMPTTLSLKWIATMSVEKQEIRNRGSTGQQMGSAENQWENWLKNLRRITQSLKADVHLDVWNTFCWFHFLLL